LNEVLNVRLPPSRNAALPGESSARQGGRTQDRRYKPANQPPDTYQEAVARARQERADRIAYLRNLPPLPEAMEHDEF